MITNHILEDKWRVQRALEEQAGHDAGRYLALTHQRAMATQERYEVQFRYTGGVEPGNLVSPKEA